jgi:hypothetical protein
MTGHGNRALFVISLALQAVVVVAVTVAARLGATPSLVVLGLAVCFVPYAALLACSGALADPRAVSLIAIIAAMLFGAAWVFAPPMLSDDLYRYLWEGRLWLDGLNPYRFAPDDPVVAHLRDEAWTRINNKPLASIYPPISQFLFVATAALGGTTTSVKVLALLAHLVSAAVTGRVTSSPRATLALALNPLLLSEAALNGHFDILCGQALLIAVWALGQRRFARAGAATVAAIGLKLVGLVLLPLLWRRPKALFATALGAALMLVPLFGWRFPADPVSGTGQFAVRWRGNESLFAAVDYLSCRVLDDELAHLVARTLVALALMLLCIFVVGRRLPPLQSARVLVWSVLLLSPQVHPWYLAWLLPLEVAAGASAGLAWSALVLVAYAPLDSWVQQRVWVMPLGLQILEYSLLAFALVFDPRRPSLRQRPSSQPVSS